jgi:hypothetical protein
VVVGRAYKVFPDWAKLQPEQGRNEDLHELCHLTLPSP